MSWQSRKVLYIDLSKNEAEVKAHSDLWEYIGGLGIGARLLNMHDDSSNAVIFSVGPLTGFYPFVSKTSVVYKEGTKIKDFNVGGGLASRIKFAGLDAIVISGVSSKPVVLDIMDDQVTFRSEDIDMGALGLPGKRSGLVVGDEGSVVDGYFKGLDNTTHQHFRKINLKGFVITGTKIYEPEIEEDYKNLYKSILDRVEELSVKKSKCPSCSGCPMGCSRSKVIEKSNDVLVNSLVACGYAKDIYSDVNVVFACCNALGYGYTHEDIENFSNLVYDELKKDQL